MSLFAQSQFVLLLLVIVVGQQSQTVAAQQYPTTPYQSYSVPQDGSWSVTSPSVPDVQVIPGYDDSEAMSPDSWSSPSTPMIPQQMAPETIQGPGMSMPGVVPNGNRFVPQQNQNLNLNLNQSSFIPEESTPDAAGEKSVFLPAAFGKESAENPSTQSGVVEPGAGGLGRYPLAGNQTQSLPVDVMGNATTVIQNPTNQMQSNIAVQMPYNNAHGPVFHQNYQPNVHQAMPNVNGISPMMNGMNQRYRPDLGHRSFDPTIRNFGSVDRGQKYDFEEKKKQYPPMSEILATGRYFGSVGVIGQEPHFQANTAISISNGANSNSELFAFDLEGGPALRFGFESKYGPGIELSYWQIDGTSDIATFTSDGTSAGETSTWMMGASQWSRLTASNSGDTINAVHDIDVEVFGVSFFKEVQLPISRINGSFGFQYAKIFQSLDATLANGGATIGTLRSVSDMEAYGPRLVFEYYRPVGHTKLEFLTTFGASVLFGDRNQLVENTVSGETSQIQANEFLTAFDFFSGAQFRKNFAENRSYFARAGITYSTWIGGGTANDPQGSFGLRGFSFSVGYNR